VPGTDGNHAKTCMERIDFAAVTGFQKPDFRTISLFRKRCLTALGGLFQQVLVLCRQAGLPEPDKQEIFRLLKVQDLLARRHRSRRASGSF